MATPGPDGPPERSPDKRHYWTNRRSKASRAMMDQVNFEATRPGSADPAVALAEALGQLPKTPLAKAPVAKAPAPATPPISVAALAQELGLKLGEQAELTIRRIQRGKG